MAKPEVAEELDQLVAQVRRAEPPALTSLAARGMVKRALAQQAERSVNAQRRARYAWLAAAAALLMGIVTYGQLQQRPSTEIAVAADGLPLRLSLETGDTLVLAPEARLQVLSERPALRRVRLERGDALFDVTRREPDERFEVLTPHARLYVRGTVFTVLAGEKRSVVRVHEGSVWTGGVLLEAGSIWTSDGEPPSLDEREQRAWTADVRAALDAHAASKLRAEPDATADGPPWQVARTPEPTPIAPAIEPDTSDASKLVSKQAPARRARAASEDELELPDLHQLRELVRLGQFHQVVHYARTRSAQDDAFALILADGLRALGRFAEACAQYEELAARAPEPLQTQVGFAAAQLALLKLGDATRALRVIEVYALSRADSPLAERASVLHVQALLRLGRTDEARHVVARYIAREPNTEAKERMRRLVGPLPQWETPDPLPLREPDPLAPRGRVREGEEPRSP